MLQAFVVVPVFALAYLIAGPPKLGRRLRPAARSPAAALVVSSLWWVVAVMAIPAADRPYIGGSQNNSLWNLIFGYNGFGRLTGNESGSVGGGGGTGGPLGADRVAPHVQLRLRRADLVAAARGPDPACWPAWSSPCGPGEPTAAAPRLIIWGGWLVVTGLCSASARASSTPTTPSPWPRPSAPSSGSAPPPVVAAAGHAGPAEPSCPPPSSPPPGGRTILLRRTPSWHPWLRVAWCWPRLSLAVLIVASLVRRTRLGAAAVAAA